MSNIIPAEATHAPIPRRVKPMLTKLIEAPFDDPGWFFEIKWDGYRTVTEIDNGKIKLYSRNGLSFNDKFKLIVQQFQGFGHDAVFDGEMVVMDKAGRSDFQLMQNYQKEGVGRLLYCVFDILHFDGRDLRPLPLAERKKILKSVLPASRYIKYSAHIVGHGKKLFQKAAAKHWEGIIGKDSQSPYLTGKRTGEWVKIKTHMEQEAVIGGYTQPQGARKYLGALVLGVYDKGKLVYIGHAGGGFDEAGLKEMHAKLKKLAQKESPFAIPPETNTPVVWVKPKLVCEVKFEEWTGDGHMRQPIYLGLRVDKSPKEVHRE